jgi:hypothetical protein
MCRRVARQADVDVPLALPTPPPLLPLRQEEPEVEIVEKPPVGDMVAATRALLGLPPLQPLPVMDFAPPALQQASRSSNVATQSRPRSCR